jgi:TorA maturation chaperone TorD
MRHLVASGDDAAQREFFETFIWPAATPLCDAIGRCERARFYRHVARFAQSFATLEHSAFEMD